MSLYERGREVVCVREIILQLENNRQYIFQFVAMREKVKKNKHFKRVKICSGPIAKIMFLDQVVRTPVMSLVMSKLDTTSPFRETELIPRPRWPYEIWSQSRRRDRPGSRRRRRRSCCPRQNFFAGAGRWTTSSRPSVWRICRCWHPRRRLV